MRALELRSRTQPTVRGVLKEPSPMKRTLGGNRAGAGAGGRRVVGRSAVERQSPRPAGRRAGLARERRGVAERPVEPSVGVGGRRFLAPSPIGDERRGAREGRLVAEDVMQMFEMTGFDLGECGRAGGYEGVDLRKMAMKPMKMFLSSISDHVRIDADFFDAASDRRLFHFRAWPKKHKIYQVLGWAAV